MASPNDALPGCIRQRRWLLTSDGVRVRAELRRRSEGPRNFIVVVAHGFSGSLTKPMNTRILDLMEKQVDVLAIEFRGHGRSAGGSTLANEEIHEIAAAVGWARLLGYSKVATLGFSMGAAAVIRHAGLIGGTDAAVAVSAPAFWNYRGTPYMRRLHLGVGNPVGRTVVRFLMGTRIKAGSWPEPQSPATVAEAIAPTPLLVVHGTEDAFFPDDHPRIIHSAGRRGWDRRGEPGAANELWLEEGFGHAEVAVSGELLERVAGWLNRSLAPDRSRVGRNGPEAS